MVGCEVILGLDLGQRQDHSAVVVMEVRAKHPQWYLFSREPERSYRVRLAERLPLELPYGEVVERVRDLVATVPAGVPVTVVADATGVGGPVVEALQRLRMGVRVAAVVITGGEEARTAGGRHMVPKKDLVAALGMRVESGSLRVAARMAGARVLLGELGKFRARVGDGGLVRYAGAGEHDDLVMALALACWWVRPRGTVGECSDGRIV